MEAEGKVVGTKCCGTCLHCREGDVLRCGKRERGCKVNGHLYVDAFHTCPLWRPKKAGVYV